MGFEYILVERSGEFATITMNRPQRRNALSLEHMRELISAFAQVGDSDALGIVLAGRGPVFSAGHDFADVADSDLPRVRALLMTCTELMTLIQQVPQPVVARVHGLATAAGCQHRPSRGQRRRRLRRARRQGRLVLPYPDGGHRPEHRPQAGRGNGYVG
jgi:enoyl-CoA hydratase/carnithine racemase